MRPSFFDLPLQFQYYFNKDLNKASKVKGQKSQLETGAGHTLKINPGEILEKEVG